MTEENQVVENESNTVTKNEEQSAKVEIETSEEKTSETKVNDGEAAKIRQATEHKLNKKFEKELAERNAKIAELQKKISEVSTPPDNESVYDPIIGWRNKQMTVEEYQQKLLEAQAKQQQLQQEQSFIKPVEQRAAIASQKIPDFQQVLGSAVQAGLVTRNMVLLAGHEEGGLEILYDLVKGNSPKVLELQRLPEHEQAKELWRLAWLKNNPPKATGTVADKPITPVDEIGDGKSVRVDYDSLNYRDAYKEFLKKRRG